MSNAKVLIVDDDLVNLLHLKKALRRAGLEVVTAEDGTTALDLLESGADFDSILLDRRMPGMDGIQVLERIKRSERFQHIPVVLQTVMSSASSVLEGLKAGARYYLTKPLDSRIVLVVLTAAIDEYACKRRCWAELESTNSVLASMDRGAFHFQTLAHCHDLAALMAKACPDPKRAVIGLSELLINALEHGNLGITYEEKTALIEARRWTAEVEHRQQLPENLAKHVKVSFSRTPSRARFRIEDAGAGFNWKEYLTPNPERQFDSHGRGILLAKWEVFDAISYRGTGNCVVADIKLA